MQKLTLFHFAACPYCQAARRYIAELQAEYPELRAVEIDLIDEKLCPDIAEQYDYWFVPTFFLGGNKLHEGACERADVERVLRAALNA